MQVVLSNVDGLQPAWWKHKKLEKLREWMDKLGVDIVSLVELQTNWDKVHPKNCLLELLKGKTALHTAHAHNSYDCGGTIFQQGGLLWPWLRHWPPKSQHKGWIQWGWVVGAGKPLEAWVGL